MTSSLSPPDAQAARYTMSEGKKYSFMKSDFQAPFYLFLSSFMVIVNHGTLGHHGVLGHHGEIEDKYDKYK